MPRWKWLYALVMGLLCTEACLILFILALYVASPSSHWWRTLDAIVLDMLIITIPLTLIEGFTRRW